MSANLLAQLSDARCALRESANKIEEIVFSCYSGARLLQESERERLRQQDRANKNAVALHTLIEAAQNVVDRWDSPLLAKDMHHIIALRKAIEEAKK